MKRSISITLSLALLAVFSIGLSSCNKCTVAEEDSNTGIIISEVNGKSVVLYVTAPFSTNHITGNTPESETVEVSFDGGESREPVNWSIYDVLMNPMTIKCKASFVRDVTVDNNLGYVFYNVDAKTCSSCENDRIVHNYVLVPKINSGYTVFFDQTITEE